MKIVEYVNEYKNNVNNLMYEILVSEYGFNQFGDDILSSENNEYCMGNNKLWIAMENGEIIGTTGIIEVSDKHAILKKIYVKESHRGHGIAQKLLNQCLDYARNIGYDYVKNEWYITK